jgi:hypothetical protein
LERGQLLRPVAVADARTIVREPSVEAESLPRRVPYLCEPKLLGEHRPHHAIVAAQASNEVERDTGRTLERPTTVFERIIDKTHRTAVEDQLTAKEHAALEPLATQHYPFALEMPTHNHGIPFARTVRRGKGTRDTSGPNT